MTIAGKEPFTAMLRCPICGGWDTQPRGQDKRCAGFYIENRKWAMCMREPGGSHHTTEAANGTTLYAHLLRDEPLTQDTSITFSSSIGRKVAEYNYHDDRGRVAYQQQRFEPKTFRLRRPNGSPDTWISGRGDGPHWMYKRHEVLASEGPVFLCEGEKDVEAMYEHGLTATCSVNGAGSAKQTADDMRAVLSGRDVCIVRHGDAEGEKYAKACTEILDGHARSVRTALPPGGAKDAALAFLAGATASAFLELAVKPEPGPVEWVGLADMAKPLPPIDWICEGLKIARGPCACLAGYGYSGKTAIAQALLLCLATGKPLFGLFKVNQLNVGWLDYEQGWRMSAGRLQRQARGLGIDLSSYPSKALRYAEYPNVYLTEKGDGVDKIAKAVDGMGLCLMDSARALTPGIDENDSRIRIPFDALSRVTMKTGCTFLVVHHYGKAGDGSKPLKERMRGSSALFDAMHTVWGLEAKERELFTRVSNSKERWTNAKDLEFGVQFVDDSISDAVSLRHLDPEQMKTPTKAALYKAQTLETIKANPKLTSVEAVRFHQPEGFRNLNETRSALRELEDTGQVTRIGSAYHAV